MLAKIDKHFLCSVSKDFASWETASNIYTRMFEYTLPAEDGLIKTNKKNEKMGRWNIKVYKSI